MNKEFKTYALIWAILLIVFNVIVFVVPKETMNGTFWLGYIFITLAFIGQLACSYIALKAENLKKLFYNIPLISVSYTGLILMLIAGSLTMAIPNIPSWIGIIVCLLIFAFTAIAVIKANTAADVVNEIDNKVKTKTFFIKSLTVDAESLIAHASSEALKAECKKVYEAVRYSDPMSNDALAPVESQITIKFTAFSDAVNADDENTAKTVADELVILISDRNKKCKLLKG